MAQSHHGATRATVNRAVASGMSLPAASKNSRTTPSRVAQNVASRTFVSTSFPGYGALVPSSTLVSRSSMPRCVRISVPMCQPAAASRSRTVVVNVR